MTDVALPKAPTTSSLDIESPFFEAWRVFRRSKSGMTGLTLIALIVGITVVGPWIYTGDPQEPVNVPLMPPGEDGLLLGTDYLGRDLLALLIGGGQGSLLVGLSAALMTMVIGTVTGATAGYYGGIVDRVLTRLIELFQVLPPLIMAMTIVLLFGASLTSVSVSIGLVSWPTPARLARAEFMRIRELDYVKAARGLGARDRRIIWRLILPNAMPPLIVSATIAIGVAILYEGGLSFLGLGDANANSWGLILGQNRRYMLEAWWVTTFPGLAIFLTVLAISLVGDGLNDALNPRLRER